MSHPPSATALAELTQALAANAERYDRSGQFPADNFKSTKTRVQVQAELAEAMRVGDLIVDGQTGLTAYQLNPSAFPERSMATGKTRAEVLSELEKARMDGSLVRLNAESQRG